MKASVQVLKAVGNFAQQQIENIALLVEAILCDRVADYNIQKGYEMSKEDMKLCISTVIRNTLIIFMMNGGIKKIDGNEIKQETVMEGEEGLQGEWDEEAYQNASGAVLCVPIPGYNSSLAVDIGLLAFHVNQQLGDQIY
eukprot:TRINITY_DN1207_c0_g1_i6.p1 TRINITY_DN1207_c0_g1~~TRINITY_DN1207_c0_g1_i6.p1  ORF type:complete len:140 (-),score=27.94 TRINITY_DN1207_c0_g1_i6:31-450(-)